MRNFLSLVWHWFTFSALVVFVMASPLIGAYTGLEVLRDLLAVGCVLSSQAKLVVFVSTMLGMTVTAFSLFTLRLQNDRHERESLQGL